MIVAVEQRLVLAVAIPDLPDPDVRMPDGNILALREGDAEQARCAVERGCDHIVEREVRLYRGVVEIGAVEAELFGVEAPVPGRELEIAALRRDQRLHLVAVRERPGTSRFPDPLQKVA